MTLRARLGLTMLITAAPLVAGLAWFRADMETRNAEDRLREVAQTYMDTQSWEALSRDASLFGGHLEGRRRDPGGRGPERVDGRRGPGGRDGRRGPRREGEHPLPPGPGARGPRDGPRGEGPPPRRDGRGGPPEGRRGPPRGPGMEEGRARPRRPRPAERVPPPRRPGRAPHDTWVWVYDEGFASANANAPAFPTELRAALEAPGDEAGAVFSNEVGEGHQLALRMLGPSEEAVVVLVQRVGEGMHSAVSSLVWGSVLLCAMLFLAVLLAAGPIVRRVRRLTREVGRSAGEQYAVPATVGGNDEIADLARAFNDAGSQVREHVEDLEQREKTLRGFVANTTHDVMIPLTVLQGHLSTMSKRLEQGEGVEPERVVSSLEEAHYMGSLIHNLSAVAKLEAGAKHIQRHPVDLNGIVERAVARHRPMGKAREIQVDFAVPEQVVRVEGDVTLLEQAVSNLVQNAVRYNDRGGHVAVLLEERRGAEAEEPTFSLKVLDDGPGMPAEQLERLPERRFRGDEARTRHPEGLGLGLSIAWDVAERHGLSLEFRASEYGGLEAELSGSGLPS